MEHEADTTAHERVRERARELEAGSNFGDGEVRSFIIHLGPTFDDGLSTPSPVHFFAGVVRTASRSVNCRSSSASATLIS